MLVSNKKINQISSQEIWYLNIANSKTYHRINPDN